MRVIGIMSGTSCDGVDALMMNLRSPSAPHEPQIVGRNYVPFPKPLQQELLRPDTISVQRLCELQFALSDCYADAVKGIAGWETAECCGMHGQTLWHQVSGQGQHSTLQIGSSGALAQSLRMPVVGDFRSADVALGGQGAPIAPIAHWFFAAAKGPSLIVNFGGMSNVTLVTEKPQDVVAYDLGPGMVLSDAFASLATQGAQACDLDGHLSAGGEVVQPLLDEILGHPFVHRTPPKSTGREEFGHTYFSELLPRYRGRFPNADIARTLALAPLAILKETAERYDPRLRAGLRRIVLTGGGAKNPTLVSEAKRFFPNSDILAPEQGVLASANHEPAAMALIAARTMQGLPSSLPQVTGARCAAVLGHVYWPSEGMTQASAQKPAA